MRFVSRRFFAPEVVQTSALDCGPAALKCLLEGFHIRVSYGRLREACQTGIDGTSIDTLEAVANQLGLDAEQVLLPADCLLLPEAKALPCLIVVTLPNGLTHFAVLWRRLGAWLQVMDPAVGRRWIKAKQFLSEVYIHTMPAAAIEWRDFAASEEAKSLLSARLRELGMKRRMRQLLLAKAVDDRSWRALASLDAATRLIQRLKEMASLRSERICRRMFDSCLADPDRIPAQYWPVCSGPLDSEGGEQLLMRGAVLIRVRGAKQPATSEELGPELTAALNTEVPGPGRELLSALWQTRRLAFTFALGALLLCTGAALVESILFRGLLDVSAELGLPGQRMGAIAAVILFCVALLLLELPIFSYAVRVGRHIENRLRVAFLRKIPKLGDRYFASRLISDMAERSHAAQRLRDLAGHMHQLLRAMFELGLTAAGIVWLEPSYSGYVLAIAAAALVPAFAMQSLLSERDLRVRTHAAGLMRFYLDAMLGLVAARAHGAENAVRREHERFLGKWAHASVRLQEGVAALETLQLGAIFGLIAMLFVWHPLQGAGLGRVLLIAFWMLNLPALGQEIGTLLRQYPAYRNLTLRLIEPLGAPEDEPAAEPTVTPPLRAPSIEFRDVAVEASGHMILQYVDFAIEPSSHVAIVGPSGAGKSSLLGVILGWLKPVRGEALIDHVRLDPQTLRRSIAWVDPAVQLWNRSLIANLSYGSSPVTGEIVQAIDDAMLRGLLESLPSGLQTELGEGGALVSGGEGQRVRLARAFLRKDTRLVILDEPFRGLDYEKRSELLSRARRLWRGCTLFCVTHDIAETQSFDRVLVIEGGRLIENGCPQQLAEDPNTRYARLLSAERENRQMLWAADLWRRLRIHAGRIVEDLPARRHSLRAEAAEPGAEVA